MSLSINKCYDGTDQNWDIKVTGEVDISNADELRNELNEAYEKTQADLRINLAGLSYIDSTGLGVIIGIFGKVKENGHCVLLLEPRENVRKLLRITNLDKVML